jgi:hypothetical protein
VYDDDEISMEPTDPRPASFDDMTKDEVEALLFPKYKEALSFGVQALTLSKVSDDNEEDVAIGASADAAAPGLGPQDNQGNLGFPQFTKAKDEFSKRPLPFVIGTRQFQDDDYCGLRYEEEDQGMLQLRKKKKKKKDTSNTDGATNKQVTILASTDLTDLTKIRFARD